MDKFAIITYTRVYMSLSENDSSVFSSRRNRSGLSEKQNPAEAVLRTTERSEIDGEKRGSECSD